MKNFHDRCSGVEAPRAWPNKTIKCGGHGSVSRGDRCSSWRDQGRAGINYVSKRIEAMCQSNFGPTCRLVSSLEAGPGATIGTLNQGYPLIQCEGTGPTWLSLVASQTATDPSTWSAPGPPHGRKKDDVTQDISSGSGLPWESVGPLCVRTGPPGKV
jgi:hypothetical protein